MTVREIAQFSVYPAARHKYPTSTPRTLMVEAENVPAKDFLTSTESLPSTSIAN